MMTSKKKWILDFSFLASAWRRRDVSRLSETGSQYHDCILGGFRPDFRF